MENQQGRIWIAIGAILGLTGVGLGAFGAHGLEDMLAKLAESDPELAGRRLDNWETAAHYQMIHAIGIVLTGLAMQFFRSKALLVAAIGFLIGVLVFSGMLYLLVLTEIKILGAIVPIGGVAMMVGWAALAFATLFQSTQQRDSTGR